MSHPNPIVLIVDDIAANRETLRELLDEQHYRLIEAADGYAALRLAAELPPDLVLLDVMMPGLDGYEVCRRLRNDVRLAEVPVLLITALDDQASCLTGIEAGADDFITKPFNRAELRARVRTITRLNRYRRLMETQSLLMESEARFQNLAEHSDEVFWFVSLNPERFVFVSPSVEKIWGKPAALFYEDARIWIDSIHPEDQARVQEAYKAMIAGDLTRYEEEYRVVRTDGSKSWVLASGTPIRDNNGIVVSLGGVVRDITDRKNAAEQLLRAQRLESLGMLAAGIAHDFNNALFPIIMASGMLRSHVSTPAAQRFVDTVETSAQRAADLVRQLLTFTRGSGDRHQLMQIHQVLREVIELAEVTFPKRICVESNLASDLWPVLGNPTQIHQVILNLCVNARDAMPQRGTLSVTAVKCTLDMLSAAEIADARPGSFILIEVRDTGTGIPPDVLARIWQPFFTTKGEGQGTGLGLSTVRGIVKSHGGFAAVKTQLGQGTMFAIYLPAADDPPAKN